MTNECLIKNLCDRVNILCPPCDEFSVTSVNVYIDNGFVQAWFSYWSNDNRGSVSYDFDNFIGAGKDLHSALLKLDDWLSIEESVNLEKLSQQYLSAHRELIMAEIGFGD